ncbi:hypothetical protein Leryth_019131 [Lithospermum erythrorhizon]|nr:hypothetical protein Leryth_019131 [Lithospermum erythrorhizon]
MQERDELKRVLVSAEQKCKDIKGESNFPKKLVEGGQSHDFTFIEARSSNVDIISENEAKSTNLVEVTVWEDLNLIRRKLNEAQERLSNSAVSLNLLSSLEKTILEVDELSRDRERLNERIEMKQKSFESSKHLSLALQERRAVLHKKLIALKCSISKFVSSVGYFGQREAQARVRYNSLSASINQKKEELARLEICKGEIMDSRSKMEQSEVELRSNLTVLKVKLEEENRRLEKERVLVTIDNIEKTDAPVLETNWHLTSKATDLLKSEEEIPKLQSQIKKIKEKLAIMKKEAQELDKRAAKVENDIKTVQGGIQDSLFSAEQVCHKLQSITHEKEMVLAMQAEGRKEYENMIREYYECVFEAETSEDEAKILNEDVQMELPKLESLQKAMVAALGRKTQFLEEITRQSCFVSDKIEEELYCVNKSIVEVNSMLADFNSNDS